MNGDDLLGPPLPRARRPQPAAPPARRTSVPTWPAEPPAVDASGTAFLVVGIGPAATAVTRRWCDELRAHRKPFRTWSAAVLDEAGRAGFCAVLAGFGVGARLLVAGPEVDVLAAAAAARGLGLVPEEVGTFSVGRGATAVFCAHCASTHRLPVGPGDAVECPGCARALEVHEHASAHLGSYLASAPTPGGGA